MKQNRRNKMKKIITALVLTLTCTLARAQFSDDYLIFRLGGEDGYVFYYDGSGNPALEGGGEYKLRSYYGKNEETHMMPREYYELVKYLEKEVTQAKIKEAYGVDFSCVFMPTYGLKITIYDTEKHAAWERSEKERLARKKRMLESKFNSVIFGEL